MALTQASCLYDVFFSYRWRDQIRVGALADALGARAGLRVFVDRWYLVAGEPWLGALERAMLSCRAAAICIGPGELGPWQQRELCLALARQTRDPDFRVIPVLLPGADPVLGFLGTNMPIDLRDGAGDDEFVALLQAALAGTLPPAELVEAFQRARTSVCPYRGLLHFREEDAPFFLGREPIVDELERTLARAPLVSVVGASGSGKSSVVRAGLVPRLRRSRAPVWEVATMVPGAQPLRALAAALAALLEPELSEVDLLVETGKLAAALVSGAVSVHDVAERVLRRQPGTERLLLVVDQWEELYTLTHDAAERAGFLGLLLDASGHGRLSLVLTLRGDFVGQALADRRLADRLQGAQVNVGPMTHDELRRAIEQPAHAVGLVFEPGLVDAILTDVGGEPGHLPLLEFVLRQLWEDRAGDRLRHAAYRDLGRLEGAIASRAERVFDALSDPERAALRQLFLRLARPGDGQDYTRLRATGADIADDEWPLVHRLADERLLVTTQSAAAADRTVEVSHEALLRHWSRLRAWLDRDREFLLWRERLRPMMTAWTDRHEDGDALLHGAFLVEAEKWRIERNAELGPAEQRYIESSSDARMRRNQMEQELRDRDLAHVRDLADALHRVAEQDKERTRQAEAHAAGLRRRNIILRSAVALLVAAGALVVWEAKNTRREADNAHREADNAHREADNAHQARARAQHLLARSYAEEGRRLVVEGHYQAAAPYLVEARRMGIDEPPLRMLFHVVERYLPLVPALQHQSAVESAAFSPDGTRIVTASHDNTARVWDAATGKPLTAPLEHLMPVMSAAFSPDGTRVVTASQDASARVWDAATGQAVTAPLEHLMPVLSVAFSPDGTRVVTASEDLTARIWDAASGKPVTPPLKHRDHVMSAAFSPDGTRIVTASDDNTARVWDAATGKPLTAPLEHARAVMSAAFSPDGTRVVTASLDKTARVWDAASGKPITVSLEHRDPVLRAAFSPDGRRVVTASADKTARVWNAATGEPLTAVLEHQDTVLCAAFSPDGTRIVTASTDNTARVWNAATGEPLTVPLEHQNGVQCAAFSPDGTRIVTASSDNTARVWNAATGEPLTVPLEHQRPVLYAAFSADGMRVVTASEDLTARVWDAPTGKPVSKPLEHPSKVLSARFSPDGTRVSTASEDDTVRIWDTATGKPLTALLDLHGAVMSVAAFSPDGTRIVTGSVDYSARLWDVATGNPLTAPLKHEDWVVSASFSPDGTRVVTASADYSARVWDVATGKPLTRPLYHRDWVLSAAFSPDGMRVVTASADHSARVWDVATAEPLTAPLQHQGSVTSAAFSPDGARVLTVSRDKIARVWEVATGKLLTLLLAHQDQVTSAVFSPDGTRVVTTSADRTARVWDAATGKPLTAPLQHQGSVTSAAFSPNGTRVVTASDDKAARVWDVQLDTGTLDQWSSIAERSPLILQDGVLLHRPPPSDAKPLR